MPAAYQKLLEQTSDTLRIQETENLSLPDELELQSIWYNGLFGREFTTIHGDQVRIKQFGFWNRSAGPDFLHAAIEINGVVKSGPLEIDTNSTDWEAHGHQSNPAFNDTILHVVFQNGPHTHFTRTSEQREVPKVIIPRDIIEKALNHPPIARTTAHPGRCSQPLQFMEGERIDTLMKSAAKHRLQYKAGYLAHIRETHGSDQALWFALAQTLGYRPNKVSMTLIAQRLPVRYLVQHTDISTALLFGCAGFLHPDIHEKAPEDSRQWLRELWDTWWQHRIDHELSTERQIPWVMSGIRPVNHPQRRLAALALVCRHWKAFRKLSTQPRSLVEWLSELEDPFWSHHYTLTSKKSERKLSLLGKDRIQDLLTNHILPLQILEGQPSAWDYYLSLPAPSINEKVQKAAIRLFGKRSDSASFLKRAWQHQALLQIYQDFCLQDDSDCDECPFPEQIMQF